MAWLAEAGLALGCEASDQMGVQIYNDVQCDVSFIFSYMYTQLLKF